MMNKQLLEVNGYNIDLIIQDSLFDKPTFLDGVSELYPIKVHEFEMFKDKYIKYILMNHDSLNLTENDNLLENIISVGAYEKQVETLKKEETSNGAFQTKLIRDPLEMIGVNTNKQIREESITISGEYILETLQDVCEMLEMLFKKKVTLNETKVGFDIWVNESISMPICNKEYMILREIVMLQNGLAEQKIYKDKILEEWVNKAKNARKQKDIKFNDLIIFVKNKSHLKYSEVMNLNVLQFYCDYYYHVHDSDYSTSMLFKTVSDKIPNIYLINDITNQLYDNSDDDLFVDMGAITQKLD